MSRENLSNTMTWVMLPDGFSYNDLHRPTIIAERTGFVVSLLMEMRCSPSADNLRLDHAMTVYGNRRVRAHSARSSPRTLERRSASRSVCRTAASQSTDQAATPLLETSVANESSWKLSTHC